MTTKKPSKKELDAVKKMAPSAYRSMQLAKLGKTKERNNELTRWINENWINLTATYITDKDQEYKCGNKGKKQKEAKLPSVCRPSKKVNNKTPKPLASQLTPQQVKKAIQIKKKGQRIPWQAL